MANSQPKAQKYEEFFSLVPIDFNSEEEKRDLLSQRIACGWNFTQEVIDKWQETVQRGAKTFFWIVLTSRDDVRAGHVALASEEDPPDLEVANPDKSVLTITSFFILPAFQRLGLGRQIMDRLEKFAVQEPYGSPNCKAIALHTLARRWTEEDNLRYVFAASGFATPAKGSSPEDWYTRLGYVKFKEEPRYGGTHTKAGDEIPFTASFLRKELQ